MGEVAFTWVKANPRAVFPLAEADFFMGTGYWTRSNAELCLLATWVRPPRLARDFHQPVVAPRREHSRKSDEVYERIERLCSGPYLEIFAGASPRPGWHAMGDRVGLFDAGPAITRRWPSSPSARQLPLPFG